MTIPLKAFRKFPNAGDQFSESVARHFFSFPVSVCEDEVLQNDNLLLLGSILNWSDSFSHVCGTGLIAPGVRLNFSPKSINCVRGPLTLEALKNQGIEAPALFGDPGILVPEIFPLSQKTMFPVGIIPHYVDRSAPWIKDCEERGIPVIDVFSPLEIFFEKLQQCEIILSSSLHGLIFAHAYGKRALWIELSDKVIGNGFKFYDYYLSMGVTAEKVNRIQITDSCSLIEIAELATEGNHSLLLPGLKEAIEKTNHELTVIFNESH
jgi:pyruvyltransferase